MQTKHLHPHTDEPTWNAYQAAAKRVYYRRSPTEQDRAIVSLYQALETKASQLEKLALKVALLAAEEPSASAMNAYSHLLRRLAK